MTVRKSANKGVLRALKVKKGCETAWPSFQCCGVISYSDGGLRHMCFQQKELGKQSVCCHWGFCGHRRGGRPIIRELFD
jgi:hypothetical protein